MFTIIVASIKRHAWPKIRICGVTGKKIAVFTQLMGLLLRRFLPCLVDNVRNHLHDLFDFVIWFWHRFSKHSFLHLESSLESFGRAAVYRNGKEWIWDLLIEATSTTDFSTKPSTLDDSKQIKTKMMLQKFILASWTSLEKRKNGCFCHSVLFPCEPNPKDAIDIHQLMPLEDQPCDVMYKNFFGFFSFLLVENLHDVYANPTNFACSSDWLGNGTSSIEKFRQWYRVGGCWIEFQKAQTN